MVDESKDHERFAATVLVVDDAPEERALACHVLRRDGHRVVEAADGAGALALIPTADPDVVVLDLVLPDLDGIEVCRQIRDSSDAMILMLTARDHEIDRVNGLRSGADDYVTKPYSTLELAARVEALLRRRSSSDAASMASDSESATAMVVGDCSLDLVSREVVAAGEEIVLTKTEFELLAVLFGRPRMVFQRSKLLELLWGDHWHGDEHVIDVHVANIRKKMDRVLQRSASDDERLSVIETVRGVGYRLRQP